MRAGKIHLELVDGKGKCSVPMWRMVIPAGFCNEPAYGRPPQKGSSNYWDRGDFIYVPGLACPGHGGPKAKDVAHKGDPCTYCGVAHDDVPIGPCVAKVEKYNY